jgi:hypothetical protein
MIVALAGCQRNVLPPSTEEAPEFSASGLLDGEEFVVAAGVDNFFLDPTYERNSSGVYEFVADFRKNNGDARAFRISILDQQPRLPIEEVEVDLAVTPGFYDYQTEPIQLEEWIFQFYSFAGSDKLYSWDINGVNYQSAYPIVELEAESDLDISLMVTDTELQCDDSLTALVEWDQQSEYSNFYYQPFAWTYANSNGGVMFEYSGEESTVQSIDWLIDDGGQLIAEEGLAISHNFLSNGPHQVIMNVHLTDGYFFRYSESVQAMESEQGCAASIHYEPVPIEFEVSKIRVDYTDDAGTQFSSLRENGVEADGSFEIVSVEELFDEQNSIATRRIEVVLNCTLYEVGNDANSMVLEGFSGVMAVSFPQ